ncbi:hypothetical protein OAN61_00245 [bacterium]|nr:hypothetical protein [bacterium]
MTKADARVLFDDVSAYMRSLYGDGTTGKLVSKIAKNVLNDGQLEDGTNDLASIVIAKPMRALFDRNGSKELILVFLKLIGATTRGLQAQGKDIVEYARALGERYGFPIRCTPSCGAMANVASTSIRLNTDGPEITFTLLGHGGKKDLFLSEEEALTRAKVLGCPGTTHKHGSRHMPCANHEEYERRLGVTTSTTR